MGNTESAWGTRVVQWITVASHLCDLGSIPLLAVLCGLRLGDLSLCFLTLNKVSIIIIIIITCKRVSDILIHNTVRLCGSSLWIRLCCPATVILRMLSRSYIYIPFNLYFRNAEMN